MVGREARLPAVARSGQGALAQTAGAAGATKNNWLLKMHGGTAWAAPSTHRRAHGQADFLAAGHALRLEHAGGAHARLRGGACAGRQAEA